MRLTAVPFSVHPCLFGVIQEHCWVPKPALKQICTNYSSDHLSPGNYSPGWLFLWCSEIHRPCLKQSLWGSQLGGLSTLKLNKCFNWICCLQHQVPALLLFHCSYFSVTKKASQDLWCVRLWEEHGVGNEYLSETTDDKWEIPHFFHLWKSWFFTVVTVSISLNFLEFFFNTVSTFLQCLSFLCSALSGAQSNLISTREKSKFRAYRKYFS